MPDVLIRDIPEEDLRRLDARAATLGISRNELLRRHVHAQAERETTPLTAEHLERFAARTTDLLDAAVMGSAWE